MYKNNLEAQEGLKSGGAQGPVAGTAPSDRVLPFLD